MADKKVLVIAGTHQRETGFSHPTADLVIAHYGASPTEPQDTFDGVDGARRAELWDFGKVAVAKIRKIGEPSAKWLMALPYDRLLYLAEHRTTSGNADFAETFGHMCQWTSVHNPVMDAAKPSFFFDLHSAHRYTERLSGTGAYIIPDGADESYIDFVTKALKTSQEMEPCIYGNEGHDKFPPEIDGGVRASIAAKNFSAEELIIILMIKSEDVGEEETKAFREKIHELDKIAEYETASGWKGWYMRTRNSRRDMFEGEPYGFCFEAVHWGPENQRATARFITHYLAALL